MTFTNRDRRRALGQTCLALADLAETLSSAQWSLPTGCPGWTVHEQIAHVSSLETVLSGVPEPEPEPEHVAPEAPHVRNSIGRYMEALVDRRRDWPAAQLLAELRVAVARRQEQLAGADADPDAMLTGPTGRPMPAALALELRVFDVVAHEQDVRRAVGQPGGLDGLAGQVVAAGLPPMLAASWEQAVPGARTRLLVDGRAHGPEDPEVVLACSLADLVAAVTGRSEVGRVEVVAGDPDLAGRLVAAMPLTP
jgi:uncharacterized protein (TIGR03083 family)